ncbi:VWA domain-containing protein [Jannaschia sp. M317]|nr:VWA domain-containing protein [Jannaschia sp. M317]
MVVFDGSGSMAGLGFRPVGPPRIDEARGAMARVLPEVEHLRRIGLVTYGPGDACDAINTHFGPIPASATPILDALALLQPQGLTPLAAAVDRAAEALVYRTRPATIVLVTDGNDTCAGRPCALAPRLVAAGADLTIHVLGYKVVGDYAPGTPFASGELPRGEVTARCMAEATGGRYILTETIDELTQALRETLGCYVFGRL